MSLLLLFAGASAVPISSTPTVKPRLIGEAKNQHPKLQGKK
jgi:hypothetical protein